MLFFLIDIYILGFDIIPDFVGWMSMLGAVELLTGKVKGIERIRTFGQVMLGYELAMVVLNYIGGMLPRFMTSSWAMSGFSFSASACILCISY